MKDISLFIIESIEKSMTEKGLELCRIDEGRYLALDGEFNARYQFELSFSGTCFLCHTLIMDENGPGTSCTSSANWVDGKSIREFLHFIESLQPGDANARQIP